MNNDQFRKLVLEARSKSQNADPAPALAQATPASAPTRRLALGTTTRHVTSRNQRSDYARQLFQRNTRDKAKDQSKEKSESPPKRRKPSDSLPSSRVVAQAKSRWTQETPRDDRAERIKALTDALQLGQMNQEEYLRQVAAITGSAMGATHLFPGLNKVLLARKQETEGSVQSVQDGEHFGDDGEEQGADVDDALDEIENAAVAAVVREKTEKIGEQAKLKLPEKVSRKMIVEQLKAQRKAAADAAAAEREKRFPTLGKGFSRVGDHGETYKNEVDAQGREVLIITYPDGTVKRKVKKKPEAPKSNVQESRVVIDDGKLKVLPNIQPPEEDSGDEDIFGGVGTYVDPLEASDSDSSSEDHKHDKKLRERTKMDSDDENSAPSRLQSPSRQDGHSSSENTKKREPTRSTETQRPKRNFFANDPLAKDTSTSKETAIDPTVLAALRKAHKLDADSTLLQSEEEQRLKKRAAQMLQAADRDMEDMDMGFGGSRFDDANEMERDGEKVKFSEWKGLDAHDNDGEDQRGHRGQKRKRGPKKKKGDKNNVDDVFKAMERQRKTIG